MYTGRIRARDCVSGDTQPGEDMLSNVFILVESMSAVFRHSEGHLRVVARRPSVKEYTTHLSGWNKRREAFSCGNPLSALT